MSKTAVTVATSHVFGFTLTDGVQQARNNKYTSGAMHRHGRRE
jgi:hypothetical protein